MRCSSQNTISTSLAFSGVGLHSGKPVSLALHPNTKPTGIVFHRGDLCRHSGCVGNFAHTGEPCKFTVYAQADAVTSTKLGTTIANATGIRVATIEHLMAALSLHDIAHVVVDIQGEEIPILDGSAGEFSKALEQVGTTLVNGATQQVCTITERLEVSDGDRFIRVEPSDDLSLMVEIDFDDPAIGYQRVELDLACSKNQTRIKTARTFCELQTVEAMKAAGLGKGGSLENAIVVNDGKILNGSSLRDPQEFALHKALDLIGDLALLGVPMIGKIQARKPGHDINNRFCQMILAHMAAKHIDSGANIVTREEDVSWQNEALAG